MEEDNNFLILKVLTDFQLGICSCQRHKAPNTNCRNIQCFQITAIIMVSVGVFFVYFVWVLCGVLFVWFGFFFFHSGIASST